jgi:hypothetical protein
MRSRVFSLDTIYENETLSFRATNSDICMLQEIVKYHQNPGNLLGIMVLTIILISLIIIVMSATLNEWLVMVIPIIAIIGLIGWMVYVCRVIDSEIDNANNASFTVAVIDDDEC